jgi:hypothetical protein
MAPHLIAALAIAVALVAACDVSQKTPQTGTRSAVVIPPAPGALVVGREAQIPADTPFGSAIGATAEERSLRLYGPGVSRKRQTRI